ncbi:MAG: neutral zinc metallopeptidase [Pseudomonadota bacterium]
MRWKDRARSANVEDRRGRATPMRRSRAPQRFPRGGRQGGVRRAGNGSIILLIIVALGLWIFAGINPLQLVEILARQQGGGDVVGQQAPPRSAEQISADDERVAFLSVVLKETEDTWARLFEGSNATYTPPTLVVYSGFTNTDCGLGQAAVGPFYCPLDQQVYIDVSFFDLLAQRFGAPGDFAQAYVLAHEVGHHVQNLTGTLGRYHRDRQRMSPQMANRESIKVELQADCYAGVWAHAADRNGIVEAGDIDEALGAASAVGDDMMQRREQGYVVPESFNHGTAAQRTRWFRVGYQSGDPARCDTFGAASL